MRKSAMVLLVVVMLVPLVAAAAYAADQLIYCKSAPCYGSSNDDKIYERKGNGVFDKIIMKGGHDLVLANAYTNDTDRVRGGTGYDKINVADGDTRDTAGAGDGGRDWCIVDSRAELTRSCERVTIQ